MMQAVPAGLVAIWAMIGVVAAVILVRLRDGEFGVGVGAALFAIGGAALVALCASVRTKASAYEHVDFVYESLDDQRSPSALRVAGDAR